MCCSGAAKKKTQTRERHAGGMARSRSRPRAVEAAAAERRAWGRRFRRSARGGALGGACALGHFLGARVSQELLVLDLVGRAGFLERVAKSGRTVDVSAGVDQVSGHVVASAPTPAGCGGVGAACNSSVSCSTAERGCRSGEQRNNSSEKQEVHNAGTEPGLALGSERQSPAAPHAFGGQSADTRAGAAAHARRAAL